LVACLLAPSYLRFSFLRTGGLVLGFTDLWTSRSPRLGPTFFFAVWTMSFSDVIVPVVVHFLMPAGTTRSLPRDRLPFTDHLPLRSLARSHSHPFLSLFAPNALCCIRSSMVPQSPPHFSRLARLGIPLSAGCIVFTLRVFCYVDQPVFISCRTLVLNFYSV